MPIPASTLASQIRFALDAEGADHYDDDRDIIPAINASTRWLEHVINDSLGEEKFGEEIFRDLTKSRVFQTSKDSRISFDDFPHEVWTLLAVYPLPITDSTGAGFVPPADTKQSALRIDLYHISSENSAKRLTVEQWNNNNGNPFESGYEGDAICDERKEYAYLDPIDYGWDADEGALIKEIEVRPALNQKNVTVVYVKKPTEITDLSTDSVEFPDSVFQLIFNKSLQYISYKQGDQTNLFAVTQSDITQLVNTIR